MRDQEPQFPADAERQLFSGAQFPARKPRKPAAIDNGFAASAHRVLAVLTLHQNHIGETRISRTAIAQEAKVPYAKVRIYTEALLKDRRIRLVDEGRGCIPPTIRIVVAAGEIRRAQ